MYIRLSDGEDCCADCTIRYWERDGCCPYLEWGQSLYSFLRWSGNDTHYLIGVHHWPPFQYRSGDCE